MTDLDEVRLVLDDLPAGAVFETADGVRAVKSEYHLGNGQPLCVLLASGEYAHFPDGNRTAVRERPVHLDGALAQRILAALESHCGLCEGLAAELRAEIAK